MLFQTIQTLDTQLFNAHNHCDLKKFDSLLDGLTQAFDLADAFLAKGGSR
jgi:hypothetical protein